MAGYSGRTLTQKLGLKPHMKAMWLDAPDGHLDWLPDLQEITEITEITAGSEGTSPLDFIHLYVTRKQILQEKLPELRTLLNPAGMIWVSWPKKASQVPTDVTEDTIRDLALSLDLVDVKVCAVSEVWSGLKLVIPKASRARAVQML
ncbi:DUF3052 domain-containing protein [Deinococcus roseus]|uniref:DUF3052 domain-containing protein n=1 Tax=Deinococcus roseus TaxID=392414 RepID=A0ABQ2CZQ9_9DEIO|nr:DUF3052 domain-containing protein [Deinococcus roseus]GGJ37066.1 DUF3052 domain-containing protein [Deinococcus roseus]